MAFRIITKFKNRKIRVFYNEEKSSARVVCSSPELASQFLSKLIVERQIGGIDSIIYSSAHNSKVVVLVRGNEIDKFLRIGQPRTAPPKRKFTEFLDEIAP